MRTRPMVFKVTDSGCYDVVSHKPNDYGYPRITVGREIRGTHRFVWEECYGPIPEGMLVCHRCDNPRCINPEHLFLGTIEENNRDRDNKGRQASGERQSKSKLTYRDVVTIRDRCSRGHSKNGIHGLAAEFGVTDATIAAVVNRRTWKCVQGEIL